MAQASPAVKRPKPISWQRRLGSSPGHSTAAATRHRSNRDHLSLSAAECDASIHSLLPRLRGPSRCKARPTKGRSPCSLRQTSPERSDLMDIVIWSQSRVVAVTTRTASTVAGAFGRAVYTARPSNHLAGCERDPETSLRATVLFFRKRPLLRSPPAGLFFRSTHVLVNFLATLFTTLFFLLFSFFFVFVQSDV